MDKRFVVFGAALLCLLLTACSPRAVPAVPTAAAQPTLPAAPAANLPASTIFPAAWDDRSMFAAGLLPAEASAALQGLPQASLYRMDMTIAEDLTHVRGAMEVRYTNAEAQPLNEVVFRLFPNLFGQYLQVAALRVNGQSLLGRLTDQDTVLHVPLEQPLQPGQALVIALDFQLRVPQEAGSNYNTLAYTDEVLALAQFYPLIPVYDAAGWHVEMPPRHGDVTYSDTAFYWVRVHAPQDLTLVASGVQTAQEPQNGQQVLTVAAGPMRDFYLAGSSRLVRFSQQTGGTQVNSYVLREREKAGPFALQTAVQSLQSFNRRFGQYPYTEFYVVSTPTEAMGVEYPGVVVINAQLYDLQAEQNGTPLRTLLETTIAHEAAHQWFYALIGNDQINQPWLDEALAQYATGRYGLDTGGEAYLNALRLSWEGRLARAGDTLRPIGLPVAAYTPVEYSAFVYGRGPLFVEALARQMGPQNMEAFLKDYFQRYRWQIATRQDFQVLAEQTCTCDLDALFAGWVDP